MKAGILHACDSCGRRFPFQDFAETGEEYLCPNCAGAYESDEPDEYDYLDQRDFESD